MARPERPERNRTARSFRQLGRFHHVINSDKVFGTHTEQRFYELTKVGFTAAVRAGPGQVSQIRSFDPNAEETVFFPRLVGGEPPSHVRISTISAGRALALESRKGPLHEARRRENSGRPLAAASEGVAVAEPAGAARGKGILRGGRGRGRKGREDPCRDGGERVRDR